MKAWACVLGIAPDLLQQPVRRRLMSLIKRSPGIHASEICRETGEAWGTVHYHLSLLESNEMIQSMEAGRTRRFFPQDVEQDRLELLNLLDQGRRQDIMAFVAEHPGNRQVDICNALGVTRKTFRASVAALVEAGLIEEKKGLQTNRYFPGDVRVLDSPGDPSIT